MKHFNLETQAWEGEEETEILGSLEFLQSIYRDEQQPIGVRIRCAVEALPFEKPKLTAQANVYLDGKTFGELLDRAIERSRTPLKLIDAQPVQTAESAEVISSEVMQKPFSRMRRRI